MLAELNNGMTKIIFTKDFDYRQDEYLTIAYAAGMECLVDDECATQAIDAGAATLAEDEEPSDEE